MALETLRVVMVVDGCAVSGLWLCALVYVRQVHNIEVVC